MWASVNYTSAVSSTCWSVDSFLLFQFSHSSRLLFLGWVCVLGLPSCRLSWLTPLFHAESVRILCLLRSRTECLSALSWATFQVIPPALPVVTHPQVSHLSARGTQPAPWTSHPCFHGMHPCQQFPQCIFLPLSQRSPCPAPCGLFSMIISLFSPHGLCIYYFPLLGKRSRFFL